MSRIAIRAIAAAAVSAVIGAAAFLAFYGFWPSLVMELEVSPPSVVTGLYATERDPATGLTFAWTDEILTVRMPGLDRQVPWHFAARVRSARPDPAANPELAIFADGSHIVTIPSATDFADLNVVVPPRPDERGLTLTLRSSATMVPGTHDRRTLGVMLDWIRISPDGIVVPPRRSFAAAALVPAIAAAALALLGVSGLSAAAGGTGIGLLFAAVLARGFGPYTAFGQEAVRLSNWVWLAALAGSALLRGFRRRQFSSRALFVIGFSASAMLVKLFVLFHPDMPIGDAMFHAHRFHDVLSGKLYFTSIAPGNYSFPYAPGLYVAAMPLKDLVTRGAADMGLLRILVVAADIVAGALLYTGVRGQAAGTRPPATAGNGLGLGTSRMRMAGACAVVLYQLVPLDFRIVTVGNLTNAFAQSIAAVGFVLLMRTRTDRTRRYGAALALVLAVAFLSHTSTFAIVAVAVALVSALMFAHGGRTLRANAMAVAAALIFSTIAAVVLYYGHFFETYKAEWARISSETVSATPDAGGRGIMGRLASLPRNFYIHLGVPVLFLACAGAVSLRRHCRGTPLATAVAGWLLACLLFLLLGVLTPVDMRHYLAAIPALAVAGGIGAAHWWQLGGNRRIAVAILLAWAAVAGIHAWWGTI